MGMSASLLSQTFCLLLRQLAETLDPLWDKCSAPSPPDTLHVSEGEPRELYDFVWEELQDVWTWLFNCLDVLQSQLSFGSIVSKKVRNVVHGLVRLSRDSSVLVVWLGANTRD